MKRKELQAAKAQCRAQIDQLRAQINLRLFGSARIPDWVVNGSAQDAVDYKKYVDECAGTYHVIHAPGASNSLQDLRSIQHRLTVMLDELK